MGRCLSEEALFLVAEGEGTASQQSHLAHLESCDTCAQRYQSLTQDLAVLGQVLQEPAPLQAVTRPHRVALLRPIVRWTATATAVAAVLAVVWAGWWLREPLKLLVSLEPVDEEVWAFVEDDALPALFSTKQLSLGSLPSDASDGDYLLAALDGGWPCESAGVVACGTDPASVFLGYADQ